MEYIQGSETATATAAIATVQLNVGENQSIWSVETQLIAAVRIINPSNFFQENAARMRWRSYHIENVLRTFGLLQDTRLIYSPSVLLESSISADWIPASWESPNSSNSKTSGFNDAIRKITELSKLPGNWDSYGAATINEKTIERAIDFILDLMNIKELLKLDQPFVLPCPDGSIQFEWYYENKELEIEIPYPSEEQVGFLRKYGDILEEGSCSYKEAIEQLHWLFQDES